MSSPQVPLLHQKPVLQLLLQQALQHDIEYKASLFWQIFLQFSFPLDENFIVGCEQAPDRQDSRTRVDIVVLYFDLVMNTLISVLFVEVKRRGTAELRNVENQVLKAALEALDSDPTQEVFAMTAWGLCFRLWRVDKKSRQLVALHGQQRLASRSNYIYVDSPEAEVLPTTITQIKHYIRTRFAAAVPSQEDIAPVIFTKGPPVESADSEAMVWNIDDVAEAGTSNAWQAQQQQMTDVQFQNADIAGPSTTKAQVKPRLEVKVHVIHHDFQKDEWEFRDELKNKIRTKRTDWKLQQVGNGGQRGWVLVRNDCTYFTFQKLSNPK